MPLADVAVAALSDHVKEHGTGQDGLLLHKKDAPLARPRFGEVWRAIRTKAEMPAARFHDTRHTFASVLLSGGVSVVGHSPAELLKTYAHTIPADHERTRSVVQAAFAKAAEDDMPQAAEN